MNGVLPECILKKNSYVHFQNILENNYKLNHIENKNDRHFRKISLLNIRDKLLRT